MTAYPHAWMGLAADGRTARVCAYCPDKTQADRLAAGDGRPVTHGICPACLAVQMPKLNQALPTRWVAFSVLATVAGLSESEFGRPWPKELRSGVDWRNVGGEFEVAVHAIGSFVGVLATTGRGEAAKALWVWLDAVESAPEFTAGCGAPVDRTRRAIHQTSTVPVREPSIPGETAREPAASVAPVPPKSWAQQWEESHG